MSMKGWRGFLQQAARTVVLAVLAVGTMGAVIAWTGPGGTPPANNVSTPVNVSATAQTKAGNFTSSGNITAATFYQGTLRVWPFGGIYNAIGYTNANTGAASCPSGYTARVFFNDYVGCCNPYTWNTIYQCQ